MNYLTPRISHRPKGAIPKILNASNIKPHKISSYIAKVDPEFDQKAVRDNPKSSYPEFGPQRSIENMQACGKNKSRIDARKNRRKILSGMHLFRALCFEFFSFVQIFLNRE